MEETWNYIQMEIPGSLMLDVRDKPGHDKAIAKPLEPARYRVWG